MTNAPDVPEMTKEGRKADEQYQKLLRDGEVSWDNPPEDVEDPLAEP